MTARIDVRELQRERGRQEIHHLTLEQPPIDYRGERIAFTEPTRLTVRLTNEGRMLWADVHAEVFGRLRCSRCLAEIPWHVALDYGEEFVRPEQLPAHLDGDDGEVRVSVYQGDEIDLREGLEEQILLALPIRSVCDEACKGLCPRCGRNLNDGPCGCDAFEPDPRLAVLRELLGDGPRDGDPARKG